MDTNLTVAARSPAEVYEEQFVPALFRPFSAAVASAARLRPGQHVLDVACGTGVLACTAAERVGRRGKVTGLDASAEMLAVARRKSVLVEWLEGRAESLPFGDESFDAVVSQFGMMFFDDCARALREMNRVLRSHGRLAVAVCDAVERSPGYGTLASLLEQLFGVSVATAFRAPFAIGDTALLGELCREAGLADPEIMREVATVRFPSIDALVSTERACVWTLGGILDDAQFERLLSAARSELRPFVQPDASVAFEMPALVITAAKP